ncbi:hypothetical protein DID88_001978 [Monilinia fructigena]|uniref:Uncharacterized protein n=1 Tax=Monilinia fructigena TaxID=38457 RepID=A0A395IYM0_9HELO|nr:hypothetical protein DID88_001978 [Monilinia fructigena]
MMNDRKRPNSQEPTNLGFNSRPEPESPSKKQKFSKSPKSKVPPRGNQTVEGKVETEPSVYYFAANKEISGSTTGKTSRIELQDESKSAYELPTKKQKRSNSPRQNPFKKSKDAPECTLDSTALLALASISFGSPFIAPYYAPISEIPKSTLGTKYPKGRDRLLYHEQSRIPVPPLSSRQTGVPFPIFLTTPSQPDGVSNTQLLRQAGIGTSLGSKNDREEFISEHELCPPPSPRPANSSLPLSPYQSTIVRKKVCYNKGYKSIISVENDEDEDDDCPLEMGIYSSLSPASEPDFDEGIRLKTGNGNAVPDKSTKSINGPSKDRNATKTSDESGDSEMHTRSPSQLDTQAIKRAFASKEAELKFKLITAITQMNEVQRSIASGNKYPDQIRVSVDNHRELASEESSNLPHCVNFQYDHEMLVNDNRTVLERIKDHRRCTYCLDKGETHLPRYGYVGRPQQFQIRIKRKELPWINKPIPKEDLIKGPLTRRILHLQKGSDQIIITTIEFTDDPGEDNLHAFIDRAEEDARKAGMPGNLVPVKLVVTWDNGAQLNAIQRGIKNLDKDSSVHLIRCSKGWRCAIRQMRNKWFWGNQNWTIWWMEEREDDNKDQRGTLYDTGLSKATHWCMPAIWRTNPSANASIDGQSKVGAGYTRESVAAFYKQRMVIDWPTYKT